MKVELLSAYIGAAVSLAVALLAYVQWRVSHQHQVRQRDTELLRWGRECIRLMAELERHCAPISEVLGELDLVRVEESACTSSALVDEGRLFFSNVPDSAAPPKSHGLRAFDGLRPAILDEVLRAHYVARYLAAHGRTCGPLLRQHVWTARGRFVSELQAEMGPSVKRMPEEATGEELDQDPTTWDIELDPEHMDPSSKLPRR